ncbi:hypothetical protein [Sorangium sp. So ce1389]|uniref:hypothetical protein n=1 Tax=Sorangium sp. So ce1389 TaxID=3133336 RepID=UPI003F621DF9
MSTAGRSCVAGRNAGRRGSERRARGIPRYLAIVALGSTGAAGTSGCYAERCAEGHMCEVPPPEPDPCDGDPATAPAIDGCGVFVSARGDDADPGTSDAPVKTLEHAIGLAASGRGGGEAPTRRVYACGEAFAEAIALPSGVDLWGGRRCEDGGWSYGWSFDGPDHLTTIAPGPVGIPLRVLEGGDATSVIFGVRAVAADASASDGKSSIAMILSPGAKAVVRASEIIAGDGKDGEAGEDAPIGRAKDGVPGNDGVDACTVDFATGALPVVTVCDDGIESIGGYGGDGGIDEGRDGAPGQPRLAGNGDAGAGAGSTPCAPGEPGAQGVDGGRAVGAAGAGYLSVDGWIGVRGEDGRNGGVGQGGGGGGGSKARANMVACRAGSPQAGAAGGSGGSGGCGGLGGQGGGYGGSSIGIIALPGSAVTLEATGVTTGNGARGGVGGTGQPGGGDAPGGYGGKRSPGASDMWPACHGGRGGAGGRGGDAGGGLGGSSYGVASAGASVTFGPGATVQHGQSGDGGFGGNTSPGSSDHEVGQGQPGSSMAYRQFDVAGAGQPR